MYQVLYRKWRPRSFDDVVGQQHITQTLKNQISLSRVGHAYLFIGSRGTGKTTCAKIFAKAVNCIAPKEGQPCGTCEVCKGIDSATVMDVVEMDAASNNGVNDIRTICEECLFTPSIAKYRVYIIDEVHMLSAGAFNALLKTLEEPVSHVIFILATTEAHKIPATILSRCQKFEFRRISVDKICDRLNFVARAENISITEDALKIIARISDGALRDSLSILDKCIGLSNNIDSDVVNQTVGTVSSEYLFKFSDAVLNNDTGLILSLIDQLTFESKDMMRISQELIGHFRNVMIIQSTKNPIDIIVVSDDDFQKLNELSKKMSIKKVLDVIDILEKAEEKMSKGADRRIEIETAFIKLCSKSTAVDLDDVLRRIKKLEAQLTLGVPIKNVEQTNLPVRTENIALESNLEKLAQTATQLDNWVDVIDRLKQYSPIIATAFSGSTAFVNGDYILIDAPKQMAFELLRKSSQRDKMRVAIKEVTGKVYKLGPYKQKKIDKTVDLLENLAKTASDAGVKVNTN